MRSMDRRPIVAARALALTATLILVPSVWWAMSRLPWQLDAAIAALAILAFAYRFER